MNTVKRWYVLFLTCITVLVWTCFAFGLVIMNSEYMRIQPLEETSEGILDIDHSKGRSNETFRGFENRHLEQEDYHDGVDSEINAGTIIFGISAARNIIYVRSQWGASLRIIFMTTFILMVSGIVCASKACKNRHFSRWVFCFLCASYIILSSFVFPQSFQAPYDLARSYIGKRVEDLPPNITKALSSSYKTAKLGERNVKILSYVETPIVAYGVTSSFATKDKSLYFPFSLVPRRTRVEIAASMILTLQMLLVLYKILNCKLWKCI